MSSIIRAPSLSVDIFEQIVTLHSLTSFAQITGLQHPLRLIVPDAETCCDQLEWSGNFRRSDVHSSPSKAVCSNVKMPHTHTHTDESLLQLCTQTHTLATIPSAPNRCMADLDAGLMCSWVGCACVWERSQLNESAEEEEGDGGNNQAEKIRGRRAAEDLWERALVI